MNELNKSSQLPVPCIPLIYTAVNLTSLCVIHFWPFKTTAIIKKRICYLLDAVQVLISPLVQFSKGSVYHTWETF